MSEIAIKPKLRFHASVDIQSLVEYLDRGNENKYVRTPSGKIMSTRKALKHLKQIKELGHKMIPATKCDNFDNVHGCKGHLPN